MSNMNVLYLDRDSESAITLDNDGKIEFWQSITFYCLEDRVHTFEDGYGTMTLCSDNGRLWGLWQKGLLVRKES